MNAASGVISFPTDKLEVVGISRVNSILNLWVQEPFFSNTKGTINFEGVSLNPGYMGNQGNIMTVTFKTILAGQAEIKFVNGSVLANDGAGTEIVNSLGKGLVNIQERSLDVDKKNEKVESTNGKNIIILSSTHPDQSKWYSNNTPEFSWNLPEDTIEVRASISKSSTAAPTILYSPPIGNKKIDKLVDGTYYFLIQIHTKSGWSEISKYRINIDTTAPDPFIISFPKGANSLETKRVILINSIDNIGVNKIDVQISGNKPFTVTPYLVSFPYSLPSQDPGTYTLTITAFDEAGNSRTSSEDFTVEAIDKPIVSFFSDDLSYGEDIKIRGSTYPESDLSLILKDKNGNTISEEYIKSNGNGDFVFVSNKNFNSGTYTFTVSVTDSKGSKSLASGPYTFTIKPKLFGKIIDLVLNYLSVVILSMVVLSGVVILAVYVWNKTSRVIKRMRKQSKEAEKMLEKSFNVLIQDIKEHVDLLNEDKTKRKLTLREVEFLERFEKELSDADDILRKEIEGIIK
jgi:hypothetical protein